MPPRGWVIALATAMQESALRNLANSSRAGVSGPAARGRRRRPRLAGAVPAAAGLGQRRRTDDAPRTRPASSTRSCVEGRRLGAAAADRGGAAGAGQRLPRRVRQARGRWPSQIVDALAGGAARTVEIAGKAVCDAAAGARSPPPAGPRRSPGGVGSGFRTAEPAQPQRGRHRRGASGTEIHAAAAGRVLVARCDPDHQGRRNCDVDGYPGKGGCGWFVDILHAGGYITRYCHMVESAPGDTRVRSSRPAR